MGKYWDFDDTKKVRAQVIGAVIIACVLSVYPMIVGFISNNKDGGEALQRVKIVEIQVDSLWRHCEKQAVEDVLFKQETRQEIKTVKEGITDLKTGQQNIYNLLLQIQKK